MLNVGLWIVVGALSGWIGYLATRTGKAGHLTPCLAVGIIGGVVGGFAAQRLGALKSSGLLEPESILNALLLSAVFMTGYLGFLSTFGKSSSG